MKIKGTHYNEFNFLLAADYYKIGENLTSSEGQEFEILKYNRLSTIPYLEYRVREVLSEEELEIAVEHFKLLTQNLDLVRI